MAHRSASAGRGTCLPGPVALRLLACVAGCGTFVERTPPIVPGAVWSKAAARAVVAMSADNIPVERICRLFGVAWNTVMGP